MKTLCNEVLYKTESFEVILNPKSAALIVDFYGDKIQFRLCEFFNFKKRILALDLLELFQSNTRDSELIELPHTGRFILLSIKQILEVRDLLCGAHVMMELNSLIHQEIIRK